MNFMYDRKRVLVTGGAGFLGSHLCKYLLNQGCTVICLDNLYCGSVENIKGLMSNQFFSFIRQDVVEPVKFFVDEIYNLACPASPVHYQKYPVQTLKTSVLGALNVLNLARETNAKVLQASTSEVYGDPCVHPQNESYWGNVNPIGLRSCYDEGKRCAETLFYDYYRTYGVKIKIVRIFNTYGPNMQPQDGRVVSNFILQALQNLPITVYGDGKQTRSFCYVSDLIRGLVAMMSSCDDVVGPINLGNPSEFTINELAGLVIKLIHSQSRIEFKSLPSDDPKLRRPDIQQAQRILKWSPDVSLEEGLLRTIPYFKSICN